MNKEKMNRIASILDDIEKTNNMLSYYENQENIEEETIKSFKNTKKEFIKQLSDFLAYYDIEIKIPEN